MRLVFFKKNPFVFILIPFLIGIFITPHFSDNILKVTPYILLVISVLCVFILSVKSFGWQWIFGSLCFVFLFLYGAYRMHNHFQPIELETKEKLYFAKIKETPIEKPRSFYSVLEIFQIKDSLLISADFKIIAYFQKSTKIKELKIGDNLMFSGRLQKIISNPNPNTFNYANYLLNRHIHKLV